MKLFISTLFVLLPLYGGSTGQGRTVNSKIDSVLVNPQSATVTRNASLDVQKGHHVLRFPDLTPDLDEDSFQLSGKGTASVKLLDIHLEKEYRESQNEDAFFSLQQEEKLLQKKWQTYEDERELLDQRSKLIEKLLFHTNSGKSGDLNIPKIEEAIELFNRQFRKTKAESRDLKEKMEKCQLALERVHLEMDQKKGSSEEILVAYAEFDILSPGGLDITLSYEVDDVGWEPQYDYRVSQGGDSAELVLSASLYQESGENWDDVKVHLATREPERNKSLPELLPWLLTNSASRYSVVGKVTSPDGTPLPGVQAELATEHKTFYTMVTDESGYYRIPTVETGTYKLTLLMAGFKTLSRRVKLRKGRTGVVNSQMWLANIEETITVVPEYEMVRFTDFPLDYTQVGKQITWEEANYTENTLSQNFEVLQRKTIPANGIPRIFAISTLSLDSTLSYRTVPRLSHDVFLTATAINTSGNMLIPGELNLYLDGFLVSRGDIPLTMPGGSLTMDLGLDRRIKAEWVSVKEEKSTTGIMKKTTKITRIIEIVLENFHSRPKTVTVYDQIPMAKDNVTQVQLNHVTPELKKDGKSLKRHKEKGFLEWDIEVIPGTSRTIHYEYTITFPSDQILLNLENP